MNDAPANLPTIELGGPNPPAEGWSRQRWLTLIALVFAAHVGLIFIFGTKKQIVPSAVKNVPQLQLADNDNELVALDDPTLFALPNAKDFAAAVWLKMPAIAPPDFRWTESPRWLALADGKLGATFVQFMQTNRFAAFQLDFKPPPQLSEPVLPVEPALAQISTLQIAGDLAQRRLLNRLDLPSWPYANVIAPSKVQVLVNEAGNVFSPVLLPPDNGFTAADYYAAADQRALELAHTARFAPAPRVTFGQLIFNWHTVPPQATNAPANP
jgi:hypothetical protein